MTDSAEALLNDALSCVERECPEAHVAIAAALGDLVVSMRVGGESFAMSMGAPSVSSLEPALVVRSRSSVLRAVIEGELDIIDAIFEDQIEVVGSADALASAGDAAFYFVKGIVRCISLESLLVRLEHLSDREGPQ